MRKKHYGIYLQFESTTRIYPVVQPEVYSVVQSGDIINNKNKQKQQKSSTDVLPEKTDAFSYQLATIRELYNSVCGSYPRLVKMSEATKKAVRARLRAGYTVEDFRRLFDMAEASSFLERPKQPELDGHI